MRTVDSPVLSCLVGIAFLVTGLLSYAAILNGVLLLTVSMTGNVAIGLTVAIFGTTFIVAALLCIPVLGPIAVSGFGIYGALVVWGWPLTTVLLLFLWWPMLLMVMYLYDWLNGYFH